MQAKRAALQKAKEAKDTRRKADAKRFNDFMGPNMKIIPYVHIPGITKEAF